LESLLVLDWDTEREESLSPRVVVRAVLADNLVRKLASEVVLNRLLLGGSLDSILKSIQEHSEVLLDVHLLEDVDGLTLPVFEGVAVGFWVHVHLLGEQQTCEEGLPLQEHIVFVRVVVVVGVLGCQDVVAEPWDHEQLLVKRVHVADAAGVLDAHVASDRLFILVESDVPIALFVRSPTRLLVEFLHVCKHYFQVLDTVS